MSDTIAAIATGNVISAIGIIRLSGDDTLAVIDRVFRPSSGKAMSESPNRKLVYGALCDTDGQTLDLCLCTISRGPSSYTGEDTAELQCHGSPTVLRAGLQALFAAGARQALAGEFSKRAFLNHRMDLTQAEAVIDLIHAESAQEAKNAVGQLGGAVLRRAQGVYDTLADIASHYHAVIDYPDEDIEDFELTAYTAALTDSIAQLQRLLDTFAHGSVLHSGVPSVILGRPNAGKSSLLNALLGYDRAIVTDIPGTTRDAIDSYFENESGKYLFIDTAGMRRKSKVDDAVERYSNLRTVSAIERADVCLILIDANEGVSEQDTKVAGLAHEAGKACIIVVNKWDAVEKDTNTMDKMTADVRRDLSFMTYALVMFISALTGQRVDKLFDTINAVSNQNSMRITTGMLNNILEDATARVQPPTDKGRRLKIYYMTQVGVKPPHFVILCNDARLFHFSYQRYLENQIRAVFGLTGTPIKITIRQKGDKEE